jgi:hypothetical protein
VLGHRDGTLGSDAVLDREAVLSLAELGRWVGFGSDGGVRWAGTLGGAELQSWESGLG